MEYKYIYKIDNLKFLSDLYDYIVLNTSNILPSTFHINIESTIDIIFQQELTSEQKIILDDLIIKYIPPQEMSILVKTDQLLITNHEVSSNLYSIIGTYLYSPNQLNDNLFISGFTIVSFIKGSSSYKIRIYDAINDKVLSETDSLNNKNLQIINLTNISNIPTNDTLLEIQVQVSNNFDACVVKIVNILFSKLIN